MSLVNGLRAAPVATSGKWLWFPSPRPQARIRLFCFPNAGAGASAFREWSSILPDDIEVAAIQLPGRENRFDEPMSSELDSLLKAICGVVVGMADRPYFFFGHSMGALIAFELTKLIQKQGSPGPFHLVVSGRRAPHLPRREPPMHALEDDVFLERIGEFNGTPKELFDNTELMKLFLPILRNDFALSENYRCNDSTTVICPLTALGGDLDTGVSEEDLAAWVTMAGGPFRYELLSGDHFFIHSSRRGLLERLGSIAETARQSSK